MSMSRRRLWGMMGLVSIILSIFVIGNRQLGQPATASSEPVTPFLRSPYYGSPEVTSWMDHRYPTYNRDPNDTNPAMVRYDGETWPSAPVLTCDTGENCYDGHDGIDFYHSIPSPYFQILAADDGVVTEAGWQNPLNHDAGFGMYILIAHDNGYETLYGHLSAIGVGIDPAVPQAVRAGDQIGTAGQTGNVTGVHLHFTVLRNGVEVDPYGWQPANPVTTPDPWVEEGGEESTFLWSDGDQVGEPFPLPEYAVGYLIPPGHPNFAVSCDTAPDCPLWFYQSSGAKAVYYTCVNGWVGDYQAQWQPNLADGGLYEVLVNVPPHEELAQANPRYQVYYGDGLVRNVVLVDQRTANGNNWVSLGIYPFEAGGDGRVLVTNATGEVNPTSCDGNPANDVLFSVGSAWFLRIIRSEVFLPLAGVFDGVLSPQATPFSSEAYPVSTAVPFVPYP